MVRHGLYETGTYRDGQREGRFEFFNPSGVFRGRGTYENGQLKTRATYVAGERHGLFENYDDNGQLNARGYLNMGSFCGEWIRVGQTTTTTSTYDPCPPGLEDGN